MTMVVLQHIPASLNSNVVHFIKSDGSMFVTSIIVQILLFLLPSQIRGAAPTTTTTTAQNRRSPAI